MGDRSREYWEELEPSDIEEVDELRTQMLEIRNLKFERMDKLKRSLNKLYSLISRNREKPDFDNWKRQDYLRYTSFIGGIIEKNKKILGRDRDSINKHRRGEMTKQIKNLGKIHRKLQLIIKIIDCDNMEDLEEI